MANVPVTLSRFIIEQQTAYPEATGEFSVLLTQIGLVGKLIARDLRRAGLIDVLGTTGETNVQGEVVKRLDMIANDTFLRVFEHSGLVCVLASEEMEKPIQLPQHWPKGKYMLLFDPLDGSSNTDVNMPLGAIFSILKHDGRGRLPAEAELFRKGTEQVAAGYLLFGSSTMLVFSVGQRVHGFTLDPSIGEYLLSHENIRIPKKGKVYAANEGNYHRWLPGTQKYVDALKVKDKAAGRPYSARYSGCLVADVHRILLGGGIYLYPGEIDKPEGKLRLLYEANPMAMVVEHAGGKASTGTERILDLEPKALHQRVPLIIGSAEDVEQAEASIQGRA
ncbi:MAG: class 1 fructose-bisphosphatase [Nitrospira sp.]|jgi:fructose-1,6-bisphosphatase I|nr:class 1 fructose-bisphosphatase [Nitrospira sp.]MCW5788597.1 class 1 fructose-bisphosphatase [Nitrospira sp.]MDR4477310.1 class 1 fructose-bisphosphatase [Nitrospira sp.]HAP38990.1 class 1 fructose-bisphosphatase [Nitrospira sp.]